MTRINKKPSEHGCSAILLETYLNQIKNPIYMVEMPILTIIKIKCILVCFYKCATSTMPFPLSICKCNYVFACHLCCCKYYDIIATHITSKFPSANAISPIVMSGGLYDCRCMCNCCHQQCNYTSDCLKTKFLSWAACQPVNNVLRRSNDC